MSLTTPCKKFEEDRGPRRLDDNYRNNRGENTHSIFEAQERDLPPLPDEDEHANHEMTQLNIRRVGPQDVSHAHSFAVPLKPSSPLLPHSLATPSTHDLVFPTYRPRTSSLRPRLRLETGWDSSKQPSTWAASHTSVSFASHKSSPTADASRQHKYPSHEDLAYRDTSSIPDAKDPGTVKPAPVNCRFLSAVRLPKLPAIARTAQTKRAVSQSSVVNSIVAKPFMRSDPTNPLHGITVTVHRQHLVSEPMPGFRSPSTASLQSESTVSALALDKPLPTPVQDLTRDLPALPASSDDPVAVDAIAVDDPSILESESNSLPSVPPTTSLHASRRPKRRKRYRSNPVPASRA
ncbi:hypothetical protein DFH06DRAFT_1185658 [Mycena polygramma]|nr:hypothetical protein DFH06DRAFT_1185658 [Mycena polygramma]